MRRVLKRGVQPSLGDEPLRGTGPARALLSASVVAGVCGAGAGQPLAVDEGPVVVGERNSSVSEMMQLSAAPLMASGILAASSPIRSYMMVAVQASGRMVMSIGPFVSSPPASL